MSRSSIAVALVVVAALSTACGSGGSSSGHATKASTVTSAPTSAPASATTSAAGGTDAFCAHIAPGGSGPANAFMGIQLWQAGQARKAALAEAKLMDGVTPPAAIAQDWQVWSKYVHAVIRATDGGRNDLESVGALEQKTAGPQNRLTKYAFAHCGS